MKPIGGKVRSENTQKNREKNHHNTSEDIKFYQFHYYQLGKT